MSRPSHQLQIALTAIVLAAVLSGCGGTVTTTGSPPEPPPGAGVAISGRALAGAQPLIGATVQLYAAGTTGNGSTPTSLSASAASDASGAFTIPAGYTCPTASSQLYLVARGGSLTPAASGNPAIALITPLGRCDALSATADFIVNEATTAATAWALSQFLAPGGDLGATATNTTGLANAVATALSLTGNTTGVSPGPSFPANGLSPAPRINTLANLLNACTANAGPGLFRCTSLLALAAAPDPAPLADTLQAAIAIVRSPAHNVLALYNLSQDGSAFAPALPSAPADWTLSLTFSGGGMNQPGPIAIDRDGDVWVGSYFGVVSEFSPTGAPVFPSGLTGFGLSESYGLAIDPSGNVWVTDESSPATVNGGYGAVTVFNSAGQSLSGATGFSTGGLNFPSALAIDPNGAAWVVDYGDSHLTELSISGQPLSGAAGYTSSLLAFPVAIAVDAGHGAWIANTGADSILHVSPDGQQFTEVLCCNTPSGLALDRAGNVWVANYLGDSISEVSATGAVLSTGYTGGGLFHPQGIAIDGSGDVWATNFRGNSITELAGAASPNPGQPLSPAAGWAPTATSLQSFAIAIDASGNVWTTSFSGDRLIELVGLGTPVKTPLSALPQTP